MCYGKRFLVSTVVLATFAAAQPCSAQQAVRDGRWALEGGLGFTVDPDLFAITTAAPYGIDERLLFVPTVQWAVGDNRTIIAPTASVRWLFPLSRVSNQHVRRLSPFAEGGLGFAWLERGNFDEVGFLLDLGFGADYALNRDVSLVSAMRFNILPTSPIDETFFYSWQVLGAQYRF